ncbi:MAG: hypothetical protein U9R43_00665, partial [Thermodesulfobacteriota bacterium]|nr:hypothetical protein [Thermodesulfobacteriota bacterium]
SPPCYDRQRVFLLATDQASHEASTRQAHTSFFLLATDTHRLTQTIISADPAEIMVQALQAGRSAAD